MSDVIKSDFELFISLHYVTIIQKRTVLNKVQPWSKAILSWIKVVHDLLA